MNNTYLGYMRMRKKSEDAGIVIPCLIALASLVLFSAVAYVYVCRYQASRRLDHLLLETDYRILLDACRDVERLHSAGNISFGTLFVRRNKTDPNVLRLPKEVVEINPLFVSIDLGKCVRLEMTGIPATGVVAYPDADKEKYEWLGNVELIPGLWFYHEDYSLPQTPCKAQIDPIITEGKSRQKEREKAKEELIRDTVYFNEGS